MHFLKKGEGDIITQTKNNISQLSIREKKVLIAIQEKPLATFNELAEMTNLSKSVVFGIVKKLEGPPNSIPYFSVKGLPYLKNLGLEFVNIIVKADSEKKLHFIKKVADEYPYCTLYNRTFGDTNGMFVQLRNPIGSINLVQKLLQKLKNSGFIDDFSTLQFSSQPIYSKIQINAWDPEHLSWNFSWKKWFEEEIDSLNVISDPSLKEVKKSRNVKSWLKQQDIAILGELFWNARRKNSDMIERLKKRGWEITGPTFSRRLKMVNDECIDINRAFLYPKHFDILNTFLIWGYGDEEELQKIKSRMELNPIPFNSTLRIESYKIFWYLHLPTTHMSDLLFYLRPKLVELHLNYIDAPRTKTYLLNTEAWDEKKHAWKIDEDYCINQVLDTLKSDK
ncbi:MAG: winged helix-turn-helix domain-containing protein [Promethearchaeota archaeon]